MIDRFITKKILEDASYFPAISIIGPRQVGKTTLAKTLQTLIGKESLYFDLEFDEDARQLVSTTRFLRSHQGYCARLHIYNNA